MPPRKFPIDPDSEAFRFHGYRNDAQRRYLREQLRRGNNRPVADYVHTLRYDDYDYASLGRLYADLYEYLDEYPPDERDELLRGIMSPSAE